MPFLFFKGRRRRGLYKKDILIFYIKLDIMILYLPVLLQVAFYKKKKKKKAEEKKKIQDNYLV